MLGFRPLRCPDVAGLCIVHTVADKTGIAVFSSSGGRPLLTLGGGLPRIRR